MICDDHGTGFESLFAGPAFARSALRWKFFIGVRGGRVYCRSICPAPTAKEENCRYFPSAAAAAEAGYRPCLRCRPECSPGTPAWLGTPNTVSRALRLIAESGFEDGGVEGLVTPRRSS